MISYNFQPKTVSIGRQGYSQQTSCTQTGLDLVGLNCLDQLQQRLDREVSPSRQQDIQQLG